MRRCPALKSSWSQSEGTVSASFSLWYTPLQHQMAFALPPQHDATTQMSREV